MCTVYCAVQGGYNFMSLNKRLAWGPSNESYREYSYGAVYFSIFCQLKFERFASDFERFETGIGFLNQGNTNR